VIELSCASLTGQKVRYSTPHSQSEDLEDSIKEQEQGNPESRVPPKLCRSLTSTSTWPSRTNLAVLAFCPRHYCAFSFRGSLRLRKTSGHQSTSTLKVALTSTTYYLPDCGPITTLRQLAVSVATSVDEPQLQFHSSCFAFAAPLPAISSLVNTLNPPNIPSTSHWPQSPERQSSATSSRSRSMRLLARLPSRKHAL
jgi:hypothetical protein